MQIASFYFQEKKNLRDKKFKRYFLLLQTYVPALSIFLQQHKSSPRNDTTFCVSKRLNPWIILWMGDPEQSINSCFCPNNRAWCRRTTAIIFTSALWVYKRMFYGSISIEINFYFYDLWPLACLSPAWFGTGLVLRTKKVKFDYFSTFQP